MKKTIVAILLIVMLIPTTAFADSTTQTIELPAFTEFQAEIFTVSMPEGWEYYSTMGQHGFYANGRENADEGAATIICMDSGIDSMDDSMTDMLYEVLLEQMGEGKPFEKKEITIAGKKAFTFERTENTQGRSYTIYGLLFIYEETILTVGYQNVIASDDYNVAMFDAIVASVQVTSGDDAPDTTGEEDKGIIAEPEQTPEDDVPDTAEEEDKDVIAEPEQTPGDDAPVIAEENYDIFLKSATTADLLALRDEIDVAIKNADEWEEVNIPVGTYQAGIDIPAGRWAVSAGSPSVSCSMMIGELLKDNGKEIDFLGSDSYYNFSLSSEYQHEDLPLLQRSMEIVDLPDSYYVVVSRGSVLFSTYHGQPNFQFFAKESPSTEIANKLAIDGLAFDELIAIKNTLNFAIWNSYDWDSVLVPHGIYTVGIDIPEGHWTITPPEASYISISYGSALHGYQMDMQLSGAWKEYLRHEEYHSFRESHIFETDIAVENRKYICVNGGVYAWFTPFEGKKALGFKQFDGKSSSEETPSSAQEVDTVAYNGIEYEKLDYKDNARNPSLYEDKKIMFTGEVIQVIEGSFTSRYRVCVNAFDIVLVTWSQSSDVGRILEDDKVTVYATSTGITTYESALGGKMTIPSCVADAIVLKQ